MISSEVSIEGMNSNAILVLRLNNINFHFYSFSLNNITKYI